MGRAFEYRRAAKEKRWGHMSRVFPKLAKAITVAAKEGGPEPETNAKLRTAIQNAKAQNMPKDNITAAVKRAEGKDVADFAEVIFEGKGPHGVLVFVECATDNNNRSVANVKSYFNKSGGSLVPTGSLEFMFDRKAVFEIEVNDELNSDLNIEELEFELIDYGLEEIDQDEDLVIIFADYTNFGNINDALETKGIEVKSATLKRISNNPQEFTDEQIDDMAKLFDKLDEDDDVQAYFNNLA